MPVIGRRDDHGLQILIVEHFAEVGIGLGDLSGGRDPLFQARL